MSLPMTGPVEALAQQREAWSTNWKATDDKHHYEQDRLQAQLDALVEDQELQQQRPRRHVHAVLGPALGRAPVVRDQVRPHQRADEEDRKYRAEVDAALRVLHELRNASQEPGVEQELLNRLSDPDQEETVKYCLVKLMTHFIITEIGGVNCGPRGCWIVKMG